MRSEGDRWDPATVLGMKSTDEVLVIGNPAFMPWLMEVCRDVTSVRKVSELTTLARERETFDKIIITREVAFTPEMVMLSGPLLRSGSMERGLLSVFPPDDGWSTEQAINFYYPTASVWRHDTTFGNVIIAELAGVSWRFYNG